MSYRVLFTLALAAGRFGLPPAAWAATELVPSRDDQILEKLAAPTLRAVRSATQNPQQSQPNTGNLPLAQGNTLPPAASYAAAQQALAPARQAVALARQTGDTRYWGRAQALIAPWWDQPRAPTAVAVLQATIQQGRHEFAPAHKTLVEVLLREPNNAQAALTLASLDRLAGRYAASLQSCEVVEQAGQPWYALACRLETLSLQGQWQAAAKGLTALMATATEPGQIAWVASLLAESEERAGHDVAAARAYERSLQADPDLYTALASADLLLRTATMPAPHTARNKAQNTPPKAVLQAVLKRLAPLPNTDAVLLRRAFALRLLAKQGRPPSNEAWLALKTTLVERDQALRQRGDDVSLHDREAALFSLWLDDQPQQALTLGLSNLNLQQEPIDWRIALQSAAAAGDAQTTAALQARIRAIGLKDQRLAAFGGDAP